MLKHVFFFLLIALLVRSFTSEGPTSIKLYWITKKGKTNLTAPSHKSPFFGTVTRLSWFFLRCRLVLWVDSDGQKMRSYSLDYPSIDTYIDLSITNQLQPVQVLLSLSIGPWKRGQRSPGPSSWIPTSPERISKFELIWLSHELGKTG